jgi:hypothetical protein
LDISRRENPPSDDHILISRRRNSSVLDVRSFRAVDFDTDHYLMVAKTREILAASKQRLFRFHMEGFNLKKLKEVEGKDVVGWIILSLPSSGVNYDDVVRNGNWIYSLLSQLQQITITCNLFFNKLCA